MCRHSVALAFLLLNAAAFGQSTDTAKRVYAESQDSVFLVYLNDSSGAPDALGSAFLVAPKTLVTNAHVAQAGSPVLAVGPVRLPLKLIRMDPKNDLAVLSVDVDLTSKPLPMSSSKVSPGDQVFAIGNPEGLERSISQGIVAAVRRLEGRDLIQITAPISHGSSGGPILNEKGEVVGVAVGMLDEGQNLNFAVPVTYVQALLAKKTDSPISDVNAAGDVTQVKDLLAKRASLEYSTDPESEYQQDTRKVIELAKVTVAASNKRDVLTDLACMGTENFELRDDGIEAARKLGRISPSLSSQAFLSYVLYEGAQDALVQSQFAEKDSEDQKRYLAEHDRLFADAASEASRVMKGAKDDDLLIAKFVIGGTKDENGDLDQAIGLYTPVASGKAVVCGDDLTQQALRSLIADSSKAGHQDDAERWFVRYSNVYEPAAYEWDTEGDRRVAAHDYSKAAVAYENAAKNSYYSYDYCYAVLENSALPDQPSDAILGDGRKCVDASVKSTGSESTARFNSVLPLVYNDMATVLEGRGVYQSALEYARESLAMKPDNPFALDEEAKIFEDLERYSECISAAQAAIRASDGKYAWMQFQLGQCYFDTSNWSQAETSYRIAAEADKSDAASAFNLGLSLARQGFEDDAKAWFREALKRNPSDELRSKILRALTD